MAPDADTMASRPVATPRPKRSLPPKPTPIIAPSPAPARRVNKATPSNDNDSSEPPKKKQKLKYIPGGPGGGGRYVDEDTGLEIPVGGTGPGGYNYVGPRGRIGPANAKKGIVPVVYPSRRDRSQRTRPTLPRIQQPQITSSSSSAAQIAAAVQSDGYKPREERGWEEFHPDLDIDAPMNTICTNMVEETPPESRPITPARRPQSANGSAKGARPGEDDLEGGKTGSEGGLTTPSGSVNGGELAVTIKIPGTPGGGKRRPGRPPKDPIAFFTARALKQNPGLAVQIATPSPKTQVQQTPRITTVQNTNPKEKLILPPPSYRKSDTLARFEDKSLGLESYVEQSMANVGYQITDLFVRPEIELIKASDINLDEDPSDMRVEYDMDEQDCQWLQAYNVERKAAGAPEITREILEITLTKIEKEWHALEKRIPKPNPKPPQTHRPRSSSAAAVNGEPQAGEEQDSKCAICDDGDCENTNAIVFCDGCDLAVHQECYGVPFIPEGQWLCRKCLLIGRGIPTCIFCPNTDGAFKQTNATKWAHLLCSMWIPEVSLGNHSFMEPVQDVEKVPKQRWKLHCYICNQKMGACIQCTNKSCYDAFHVTCARKAGLFLKMKDSNGRLAIDENSVLQACCHKHTPKEYARENDVATTTRQAQRFYKKAMKGRIWADSQESALAMAAEHRHAVTEHQPDESQLTGAKVSQTLADSKKKGGKPSNVWKLPSGAPVIPHAVFSIIESSLQRFNIQKRKDWTTDACRYWTLKREARRGAPLLKRLQLQMDTFPSMELTRRDFPGMGPVGKTRLDRRIAFAKQLVEDLEKLSELAHEVKDREMQKYQAAELQRDITYSVYFPVAKLLFPIMAEAKRLDEKKNVFTHSLLQLEEKVNALFYVTALAFAEDFTKIFQAELGVSATNSDDASGKDDKSSPSKKSAVEVRERKKHAKRIIKAVTPQFETAVRAEAELSNKSTDDLLKELRGIIDGAAQLSPDSTTGSSGDAGTLNDNENFSADAMAIDSPTKTSPSKRTGTRRTNGVKPEQSDEQPIANESIDFMAIDASVSDEVENTQPDPTVPTTVEDSMLTEVNGNITQAKQPHLNGIKDATSTPPDTNGYVSAPEIQQPNPPTPPVSNGGIGIETVDTLTSGGIPLHFQQDFQIEGTNITEEPWTGGDGTESEDDLTDMDDEELRGLGADFEDGTDGVETTAARGGTGNVIARTKKGRVKKRWRGYK